MDAYGRTEDPGAHRITLEELIDDPQQLIKSVNDLSLDSLADDEIRLIAETLARTPGMFTIQENLSTFQKFLKDNFSRLGIKKPDEVVHFAAAVESAHMYREQLTIELQGGSSKTVGIPAELLAEEHRKDHSSDDVVIQLYPCPIEPTWT